MERNTIIAGAGAALGAIALILSVMTRGQVNTVNNQLTFDTSIDVEVAGPETEAGRTITDPATGETTTVDAGTPVDAELNVIVRDGTLRTYNSTLRIPTASTSSVDDDLYVTLPGEHTVRYDSTQEYLVCDGSIIIRAINGVDATYNGICQFMGADGQAILIGERKVNDLSAVAVVYELATSDVTDNDIAVVQTILNNTVSSAVITKLTLFGTQVNPDWAENLVMTTKALELIKGTQRVYISPYSGNFADGATNTLVAGSTTFTYSDNIKDTATGYSPYIFTFNADQNGTVQATASGNGQLKVKVLAQSNMVMKDLFY